ncbi:hypothetical protein AB0I82_29550 [Streptomyces sp. NPDC050315]|uniref:hypothetical protein n=1 Tax=Streptomyces sp. NPDC050315 TaxID=3155039 RepID=UPI003431F6AD
MTQAVVPPQPDGPGGGDIPGAGSASVPGGPVGLVPPAFSETCRLLCSGVYLDGAFRDRVIKELYDHDERIVAPSYGFDAARVLAHALRARRLELGWALLVLLLCIVAVPLTQGLLLMLITPVVWLAIARRIRGTGRLKGRIGMARRFVALVIRWYSRINLVLAVVFLVALGLQSSSTLAGVTQVGNSMRVGDPSDIVGLGLLTGQGYGAAFSLLPVHAWITLAIPFLLAWIVGLQRGQFARVVAHELSRTRFRDFAADPAERAEGVRFRRLRDRIRTEQHGPLVMYGEADPFCGAGTPFKPWSLSVELRPRRDRKPEPVDNAAVLRRIHPLVEDLRVPSPQGSPEAAAAVRDRLRALELDECVFLPVDGLPSRDAAPYAPDAVREHMDRAIEEGGETRRHFLRIRVGGWGEGLVVTVFVRVHTQGRMLVLEVVPHVLWPLWPQFVNADRIAHRHRHNSPFGKAVWALLHTPAALTGAVVTLGRGIGSVWGLSTEGNSGALPDGPAFSVRELASADDPSLFQEMDAERYLKSIQDRVAGGVRLALYDAGWQTAAFEQQIVNVGSGGVFIGSAQGAVGVGNNNTITNNTTPESGGSSAK